MQRTAAIKEKRSTHCEMLVMGRRAGAGGRPGSLDGSSSVVMSAISINSKSRMHFINFDGSVAVGLNGPGAEIVAVGVGGGRGGITGDDAVDAAAASWLSPELPPTEGEEIGSLGRDDAVVTMGPVWGGGGWGECNTGTVSSLCVSGLIECGRWGRCRCVARSSVPGCSWRDLGVPKRLQSS